MTVKEVFEDPRMQEELYYIPRVNIKVEVTGNRIILTGGFSVDIMMAFVKRLKRLDQENLLEIVIKREVR